MRIPFNIPYQTGKEQEYIQLAFQKGKLSGNGYFTQKCHGFFNQRYGFRKSLLTNSCTDALEMAAILTGVQPGDEVIIPSFTFVSTANAFVLRGAKIVFCDSRPDHPGIDEVAIENLITEKTKVIVPVHYAGVACDMDKILAIAQKYNLWVVEDAAQAIDSYFVSMEGEKKPLGSIGHLATFSFHETKNIISGEGGMLVINDPELESRAEIIWEKGTNRSAFFRGEVDKYGWVDMGSSFLPSEITAAFLYAQLEHLEKIQMRRIEIWDNYYKAFSAVGLIKRPVIPSYATNNAHMFYILFEDPALRTSLIEYLKKSNIQAVFHYLSLHKSFYYRDKYRGKDLGQSDYFSDSLLRLPFYYNLAYDEQSKVIESIHNFCEHEVNSSL